jgi:hypothetical protein
MSTVIAKADYKPYLSDKNLNMIIETEDPLLDEVELTAEQVVRDALHPYYDVDNVFENISDHRQVKRWIIIICIYFIYERIPDALVPERVVKNYDDTLLTLDKISDGKISVNLPKIILADGETTSTKFKWGSAPQKSHRTS